MLLLHRRPDVCQKLLLLLHNEHEEGLLLDVATGGELFVALNAGVPGSACVLHGNNKSLDELKMALNAKVHHIVVDNFVTRINYDICHSNCFVIL